MTDDDAIEDEPTDPGEAVGPASPTGPGDEASDRDDRPGVSRVEPVDTHDGDGLLTISWAGTAVLAVACGLAVFRASFEPVLVAVSFLWFAIGTMLFARAFLIAVSVRREDLIGIGGLFFLAGSAPRRVQLNLLGSFGAEVVITLTTAAIRPYTALAFAVLGPMFGLGVTGLWGAIHGTFPRRPAADRRR